MGGRLAEGATMEVVFSPHAEFGHGMVWIFRCQPQVGTAAYQADLRAWLPIVPQVTTSPSRPLSKEELL